MPAAPPPPHPDSHNSFADPNNPTIRHAFPSLTDPASLDLSIIIPAYNEQHRLPTMLSETLSYFTTTRSSSSSYELLIVDDGSTDATATVAHSFVKAHSTDRIRLLRLQKNSGKGEAVKQGMLRARGRKLLLADADAATRFEDLELLERATTTLQADVAIGSRAHLRDPTSDKTGHRDMLRSLISFVFNVLVWLVGGVVGIRDTQCGFKLYSRRAAVAAFADQHLSRWAFDVENLYRVQQAGFVVVEVPVEWHEVPGSKLSVVKATLNMMWDMLRMRLRYLTGSWKLPTPSASASASASSSSSAATSY